MIVQCTHVTFWKIIWIIFSIIFLKKYLIQGSHGVREKSWNFEIGQENNFFGKSQVILWWRGILVVQLLSFSDKRLRQFLPFCIIVVIINIYKFCTLLTNTTNIIFNEIVQWGKGWLWGRKETNILSTFHTHIGPVCVVLSMWIGQGKLNLIREKSWKFILPSLWEPCQRYLSNCQ